ncbi:unnamed protein product [Caenorhabditis auriculariae]|uniref:Innexin n=1 Tax=Caenorhabditis auriculariae TaxID=2777116 RepID=A0A8S1HUU1_9PELO|nr:unnamed protein product [Caenorhabditis auriculariae]
MFVFRVLNTVPYTNRTGARDIIAGLHSFVTSNLLIGLAVLVSYKQFGGKPIECMVPMDFTSAWAQYAENYCWSQQTYYIPFDSPIVEVVTQSEDYIDAISLHAHDGTTGAPKVVKKGGQKVSYYQWMPFFLLFEAACFRFPCLIWKYFASQSGMQVGEILRMASDQDNAVPEAKRANVHALSVHLQGVLRFQKRLKFKNIVPHRFLRFLNLKYSIYYVTFIYFLAKIAFLLNVGLQANLLNRYLLPQEYRKHFGFDLWKSLLTPDHNNTWEQTGVFPRVTLCDFEVREMGNLQSYTVQCVLLLNLMTEKIFLILWAWYLILGAFTFCNLVSWVVAVFNFTSIEHFVLNHLEMCEIPFDKTNLQNREHVTRFINKYLGMDGSFLLQLIGQHADVVFTTELVGSLFKSHYEIEERRRALKQMNVIMPLIRPETEKDHDVEASIKNTPSEIRRRSIAANKGSVGQNMSRFGSFEAPDIPMKRHDSDVDDDEEEEDVRKSEKSSKRTSPSKTPAGSKRPSLAHLPVTFDINPNPKPSDSRGQKRSMT